MVWTMKYKNRVKYIQDSLEREIKKAAEIDQHTKQAIILIDESIEHLKYKMKDENPFDIYDSIMEIIKDDFYYADEKILRPILRRHGIFTRTFVKGIINAFFIVMSILSVTVFYFAATDKTAFMGALVLVLFMCVSASFVLSKILEIFIRENKIPLRRTKPLKYFKDQFTNEK